MLNEDLKPCLDIESEWEHWPRFADDESPITRENVHVFSHKRYDALLRVIDFNTHTIHFTDRKRITVQNVIDINKKIEPIRKIMLTSFLIRIIDAEKPITMPYVPEKIKVYIEDLGDILGVLYYMDSDPEKTLVPIKRYFKMGHFQKPEEIPFDEYQVLKEKIESEDKDGKDNN